MQFYNTFKKIDDNCYTKVQKNAHVYSQQSLVKLIMNLDYETDNETLLSMYIRHAYKNHIHLTVQYTYE